MPRILALRPGSVAGADLGHVTFDLSLGVSRWGDSFCFSLLFKVPPPTTALYRPIDSIYVALDPVTVPLVQVPIALADSAEELARVAAAATGNGSEDADTRRLTEAFELFKNRARTVAQDRLDACVRDALVVVKAYSRVRQWVETGMLKLETVKVTTSYAQREGQSLETTLVCIP